LPKSKKGQREQEKRGKPLKLDDIDNVGKAPSAIEKGPEERPFKQKRGRISKEGGEEGSKSGRS